jgi:hypothetical protein
MNDRFLYRSQARLGLAQLLGTIDRWIRRNLREMSLAEYLMTRRTLSKRCNELARQDSVHKNPSMGARMLVWDSHPMRRYVDAEDSLRLDDWEKRDPQGLVSLFRDWPPSDVVDFYKWKHENHFWSEDIEKLIRQWRKGNQRILPVLPTRVGLPSNVHGRPPNHRERGRPAGDSAKAPDPQEAEAPIRIPQGPISISIKTVQIH